MDSFSISCIQLSEKSEQCKLVQIELESKRSQLVEAEVHAREVEDKYITNTAVIHDRTVNDLRVSMYAVVYPCSSCVLCIMVYTHCCSSCLFSGRVMLTCQIDNNLIWDVEQYPMMRYVGIPWHAWLITAHKIFLVLGISEKALWERG